MLRSILYSLIAKGFFYPIIRDLCPSWVATLKELYRKRATLLK